MTSTCPVCGGPLRQTISNILLCPPRKISFLELNTILEVSHATLYFDEEENIIFQQLIIDKYTFKIYDDPKERKTVILRLQKKERLPFRHSKVKEFEWKEILTIPAVVTLPWNKPKKVVERVKTYLVFS